MLILFIEIDLKMPDDNRPINVYFNHGRPVYRFDSFMRSNLCTIVKINLDPYFKLIITIVDGAYNCIFQRCLPQIGDWSIILFPHQQLC